jgi:hypothetical protein
MDTTQQNTKYGVKAIFGVLFDLFFNPLSAHQIQYLISLQVVKVTPVLLFPMA